MKKKNSLRGHLTMALIFSFFVFIILMITVLLVIAGIFILVSRGVIQGFPGFRLPLIIFAFASVIVGTMLTALFCRLPLKPIRQLKAAFDKIAEGDFSVRLAIHGPAEFLSINQKFNHMAEELGSVEMLRSDFVNNFSHEFKTPIVSIRGFAKMLKTEGLPEADRNAYLDIIISESERLSDLSTNVLNLSKIEKQTLLTDRHRYNLSEQIRQAVVLTDQKWAKKAVDFWLECDEVYLNGNEEMLQQVWVNLLDNAVKFSPEKGDVKIGVTQDQQSTTVSIENRGEPIPPDAAAHIFDKFYQGDASRATKGNGLGLAIAKRIVELHRGTIRLAASDENHTVFEVVIPS